MLTLKKVAVTGGISSGKSSVCRFLKELGAYVVSSDEVVHHLLSNDTNVIREVVNLLGTNILVKGHIDRKKVSEIVFKDPELLTAIEKILHPVVYQELEKQFQIQMKKKDGPSLYVAEIPLLFETGGDNYYPQSLAVDADEEIRFHRFHEKTGLSREEFDCRAKRQLSSKEKAKRAQWVINNNGSLVELRHQVEKIYPELCQQL